MFVRTVVQLAGTDKEGRWQDGDKWLRAVRLVTKADGAGFSLADVRVSAGWEIDCHYKHHVEASLIVSGSATSNGIRDRQELGGGGGGPVYVVGPKDKHHVSTKTEMHAVTVFNPCAYRQRKAGQGRRLPPERRASTGLGR